MLDGVELACQRLRLWTQFQGMVRWHLSCKKTNLSTKAEWGYPCLAESTTAFANGEITRLSCDHDPIWMSLSCIAGIPVSHPSGGPKNANAWGLYDMQGEVSECCQD